MTCRTVDAMFGLGKIANTRLHGNSQVYRSCRQALGNRFSRYQEAAANQCVVRELLSRSHHNEPHQAIKAGDMLRVGLYSECHGLSSSVEQKFKKSKKD